jgi:hypothetical protein
MKGSVSDRARMGFDDFVARSARSTFAASADECTIGPDDDVQPKERELVMFTVSSYLFRVLLFVHFDRNTVTRSHFAALSNVNLEAMDDERLNDEIMERGNLCCGAFNRELAQFFPHIGMSTPCLLRSQSIHHVASLLPAYTRTYRAELSPGVVMHFSLAVCAFADLDFPFEPRAAEAVDETAGELEMF